VQRRWNRAAPAAKPDDEIEDPIPPPSPYFHDNSAKTLREVVDHYADVFFKEELIAGGIINLTEQDRQDIVAFLGRL
jgi:cytochrome c peroxidase